MENLRSYDQVALFRARKSSHHARTTIREEGIALSGRPSKLLSERHVEAANLSQGMYKVHRKWVDGKLQPLLPYLNKEGEQTDDNVLTSIQKQYNEGLKVAVT